MRRLFYIIIYPLCPHFLLDNVTCVFVSVLCVPTATHSKHAHGPWWDEPKRTSPSASSRSQHARWGYGQRRPSSTTHAEPDERTDAWYVVSLSNGPPLSISLSLSPFCLLQSLYHLGCLATPWNWGRLFAEGWCHQCVSSGGLRLFIVVFSLLRYHHFDVLFLLYYVFLGNFVSYIAVVYTAGHETCQAIKVKKKKKRLRMLSSLISGPNHMPMQGPGPGPNQPPNMPSGSMNIPPSSHGSMGGYNHTVPSSQGMPAQSQMNMTQGQPMGNYGPRPNMNMQPNQGKTNTCVNFLPTCLISSSTETIHWLKPCCECKWICVHLGNIDFFCDFICI